LDEEIETLKEDNSENKETINSSINEKIRSKEEISKQNNTIDSLNHEMNKLKEENSKQVGTINSLNDENLTLKKENSTLKDGIKEESAKLNENYESLKSQEKTLKDLQTKLGAENQKVASPLCSVENVFQGVKLLIEGFNNDENKERAFSLFQISANTENDFEAFWRIAACYNKGIGVKQNLELARTYAKKSL
jgi:phage host-nuclease inhibitor protein Gam